MTLCASHRRVSAGQFEAGQIVIERGILPTRRIVAGLAGRREVRSAVVGVRGIGVILQVARRARPAGQVVIVVQVALGALDGGVQPGKREAGGRVIKRRSLPR